MVAPVGETVMIPRVKDVWLEDVRTEVATDSKGVEDTLWRGTVMERVDGKVTQLHAIGVFGAKTTLLELALQYAECITKTPPKFPLTRAAGADFSYDHLEALVSWWTRREHVWAHVLCADAAEGVIREAERAYCGIAVSCLRASQAMVLSRVYEDGHLADAFDDSMSMAVDAGEKMLDRAWSLRDVLKPAPEGGG